MIRKIPILDYFIPDKLKIEESLRRKARILLSFLGVFWLVLIVSYIACVTLSIDTDLPFGTSALLLAMISALFYFTGSMAIGGNAIAVLILLVIGSLSLKSGGLYSMDLLFCIIAPITAFLLAGKRAGIFWSLVLVFIYIIYYVLETQYGITYVEGAKIGDANYFLIVGILTITAFCGTVWVYENEKTKNINDLEKTKKELSILNNSLEQKIKERTQSLEQTNAQLMRSNNDLEQFAYAASHDLQEPLRMVGNFVQLLEDEYKEQVDETGKSYINFAVDGVTRMSSLIEELLQYSRVGRKGLKIEEVDLNKVVEEKISDLSLLIRSKNVDVNVDKLPVIKCIPNQIGMVFYNLINNGIKFNHTEHPTVKIEYKETPTHWWFSIKDDGIGIEKQYQEQIFDLFKRLHRKEEYSGTGIGLSICKKVIGHHHGEIKINSEMGTGTTFHFSIQKNLEIE